MSENICDVALIGESGVGKTSIISRFIDNNFDAKQLPSPSATYIYTEMKFDEYNTSIRFQIWDTAGQERFRSLSKIFYKKANIIILVYDITDRNSFEEMKNYWYKEINLNTSGDVHKYLFYLIYIIY
jgi:small GTP-binding protein